MRVGVSIYTRGRPELVNNPKPILRPMRKGNGINTTSSGHKNCFFCKEIELDSLGITQEHRTLFKVLISRGW